MRARSILHIAVVGPDGVGKTTLAQGLARHFTGIGVRCEHIHFSGASKRPQGRKIASVSRVILLPGWLRVLVRFLRAQRLWNFFRRRQVIIIIEERTFTDQIVDPRRYSISAGLRWLVASLDWFNPSPDLTILLTGAPEKVANRKNELGPAETMRQILAWKSMLEPRRDFLILDSTLNSVSELISIVAQRANQLRVRKLSRKLRRLWPLPARLEFFAESRDAANNSGFYRPQKTIGKLAEGFSLRFSSGLPAVYLAKLLGQLHQWDGIWGEVALMRSYKRDSLVLFSFSRSGQHQFLKVFWGSRLSNGRVELENLRHLENNPPVGFRVPSVISSHEGNGVLGISLTSVRPEFETRINRKRREILDQIDAELRTRFPNHKHSDLTPSNVWFGSPPSVVDWESTDQPLKESETLGSDNHANGSRSQQI